ncbi:MULTISPECIES: sulfurtransferase-like selenium metabolism protein YedF [Carboxydothermus]|uniref:UPF0033 domain-containing protein n=2 Tax=Carboxydothermus TaxID=129957 RepID=A0A1L8CT41_9THEO|nr:MULTISPECIES: sulfurtransferase-like selenium metabolism protein YedF [Carboxydothermus]NYE57571.1 TusA-related sulfurtransferase [Carboxydothermus ferrireducens DSM 11255]GAV22067.1 hypothetical protein cpu_05770 [Carboxydothermus pertinax]
MEEKRYVLDLRGEPCPYPVVYSLQVLAELESGALLEILADCPQSFKSVPEEVVKAGYEMAEPPQKIGPTLRFLVRKP